VFPTGNRIPVTLTRLYNQPAPQEIPSLAGCQQDQVLFTIEGKCVQTIFFFFSNSKPHSMGLVWLVRNLRYLCTLVNDDKSIRMSPNYHTTKLHACTPGRS